MTKKLTRSKRKELRSKGQLKVPARLDEAHKAAEKQAEEEAASARVHDARETIAHREEEEEDASPAPPKKKRRDLTVLLIVALTAVAGLILWLVQRAPSPAEPAKPEATAIATGRAPTIVTVPRPMPPPSAVPLPALPAPPPAASVVPTSAPAAPTGAPAEPAKPKPVEPARPKPAEPAKPKPVEPAKPAPAPKKVEADPYG